MVVKSMLSLKDILQEILNNYGINMVIPSQSLYVVADGNKIRVKLKEYVKTELLDSILKEEVVLSVTKFLKTKTFFKKCCYRKCFDDFDLQYFHGVKMCKAHIKYIESRPYIREIYGYIVESLDFAMKSYSDRSDIITPGELLKRAYNRD